MAYTESDFPAALRWYQSGLETTPLSIGWYRALFLTGAGNCQGMLGRDAEALRSFSAAIGIASKSGFDEVLMKASVGRISIYRRVPDLAAARAAIDQVEPLLLRLNDPVALAQVANLTRDIDFDKAIRLYSAAIRTASARSDNTVLALLWNQLGYAWLLRGDPAQAERGLTEAFRLRALTGGTQIQATYFYLGWLRRLQGRNEEAIRLITKARELAGEPGAIGLISIERELARSLAATGDRTAALALYDRAVRIAEESRILTLPSESFRQSSEEGLHEIFAEYVELGMAEYDATRDPKLAGRMFAISEASRVASFRASLAVDQTFPRAYLDTLARFRRALASSLTVSDPTTGPQLTALRLELANLEIELGLSQGQNSQGIIERDGREFALKNVQTNLRESEALVSFMVGRGGSFVWALTRERFEVHRLPGMAVLQEHVSRYRTSLESRSPGVTRDGQVLADALLSGISADVWSRKDWILSLDGSLNEVPFASLPEPHGNRRDGRLAPFLMQRHSLRLAPTAFSRDRRQDRTNFTFSGIADPVYNRADPRLGGHRGSAVLPQETELPRLLGSARELKRCADAWKRDPLPDLRTGAEAGREALMRQLDDNPAILHLGMHVIPHPLAPDQVLIALGQKPGGEADYLTPAEIARWRRPLGLITLSGCSSGTGKTRPGLGLFGLTRAWLAAGATSVLASYWPIPDADGDLLSNMYAELSKQGGGIRPLDVARALQRAQCQAQAGTGWQSGPNYWAAFFVAGKE